MTLELPCLVLLASPTSKYEANPKLLLLLGFLPTLVAFFLARLVSSLLVESATRV